MLLSRAIELFISSRTNCNQETIRSYHVHLACLAALSDQETESLTQSDLDTLLAQLRASSLARVTVRKRVLCLRTFFRWMHVQGCAAWFDLELPKVGARLPKALSLTDEKKLIAADLTHQERSAVELLLDSGLRLSEALNLTWENLDFSAGTARVIGKGDKERVCVFGDQCAASLIRWRDARLFPPEPSERVFRGRQGAFSAGGFYRYLKRAMRRAGVDASPHDLRHTFARDYLNNGGNLFDLKELLGHTDIRTTLIYLSVARETLSQKHQRLSPVNHLKG